MTQNLVHKFDVADYLAVPLKNQWYSSGSDRVTTQGDLIDWSRRRSHRVLSIDPTKPTPCCQSLTDNCPIWRRP